MLTTKSPLFVILMFAGVSLSSVSSFPKHNNQPVKIPGHFTRKGNMQTVWLMSPKINADGLTCTDGCNSVLNFLTLLYLP